MTINEFCLHKILTKKYFGKKYSDEKMFPRCFPNDKALLFRKFTNKNYTLHKRSTILRFILANNFRTIGASRIIYYHSMPVDGAPWRLLDNLFVSYVI